MSSVKKFDLTTVEGVRSSLDWLQSNPAMMLLFPLPILLMRGIANLVEAAGSPSDVSPGEQAKAAERIISAGRKSGARRVKMIVDKDVGLHLKGRVASDLDIEARLGSSGKMELEVEYK